MAARLLWLNSELYIEVRNLRRIVIIGKIILACARYIISFKTPIYGINRVDWDSAKFIKMITTPRCSIWLMPKLVSAKTGLSVLKRRVPIRPDRPELSSTPVPKTINQRTNFISREQWTTHLDRTEKEKEDGMFWRGILTEWLKSRRGLSSTTNRDNGLAFVKNSAFLHTGFYALLLKLIVILKFL